MSKEQGQGGFTLIELIVVIVILGILAAFAVPKFIGLSTDARVADLQGMSGSLQAAASMVYGKAKAENVPTGGTMNINGQSVKLNTGTWYPAASNSSAAWGALVGGIDSQHFVYVNNGTFQLQGASTPANCAVTYAVTGSGSSAQVTATVTSSGC
jgi:MSHA pilin protein MshA